MTPTRPFRFGAALALATLILGFTATALVDARAVGRDDGSWLSRTALAARDWTSAAIAPLMPGSGPGRRLWTNSESPAVASMLSTSQTGPVVATEKTGYLGGETVAIGGIGFLPGDVVTLQVLHVSGTAEMGMGHESFTATADETGAFAAEWAINREDASGHEFVLTAIGTSSGPAPPVAFSRIATV